MGPSQLTMVQQAYPAPFRNTTAPPVPNVIPLLEPIIPPPALQPLPIVWPANIDLVVGPEGRFRQSDQIPEIQTCLGAAVRRANANLVFLDAFPDAHRKGQWLAQALATELNDRRNTSTSIEAVDDRARREDQYFNRLLYMVTWLSSWRRQ